MTRGVLLLALGAGFCNGNANRSPKSVVRDGVDANPFLASFPYVAAPNQGYAHTGHE